MSGVFPQCLQVEGNRTSCMLNCQHPNANCGSAACQAISSGEVCSYADPFLPYCPASDNQTVCQILVNFHSVFSEGDGWHEGSKTGWPGSPEQGITYCEWDGVKCDVDNRVTSIDRSGKGLQGNLSRLSEKGPSVFGIDSLAKLDLSSNTQESTGCAGVYGSFPADIRYASRSITEIQLQKNAIDGTMPDFSFLDNLITLDLHYNKLVGSLPQLPASIEYFSAATNFLTGGIPAEWGQLINIETLGLAYNLLTGGIGAISSMTKLKVLYIRDNKFSGLVPRGLSQLSACSIFDLQNNQLTKIEGGADGTFCGTGDAAAITAEADSSNSANGSTARLALPLPASLPAGLPPAFASNACGSDYPSQPPDSCCMSGNPLQGAVPACLKNCGANASGAVCSGESALLSGPDCAAWQRFSYDPLYRAWVEGKCGGSGRAHADPCSCTFSAKTQCAGGRITYLDMYYQQLPGSAGVPLALTGLYHLNLRRNGL